MAGTPAELVKAKLDIVEFLRAYLTLTPAGRNFKAICPFHKEKTPSFMVSPERQTWHCFGCGAGGDVFSFVAKYENVEFPEALRILAEKAGVELRQVNPAEHRMAGIFYDVNAAARNFFRESLAKSEAAKKYLKERGLAKETIETFELGWAPDDFEALSLALTKQGFSAQEIINAGLAWKNARGLVADRFRGRIMFPIHNHSGKIAGFTGRILPQLETPETGGKYVNTPETPVFQKHKLLYGFWKSKDAIREAKAALLVEGQMDFLICWQIGLRNVVATSGTAITHDHLLVLRRLADRLILTLDSDEAGKDAGERTIDLANLHDFDTRVVVLSGAKDPAEAGLEHPDMLRKAVADARSAMEFYFMRYLPGNHADYRARESLIRIRAILGKIKSLESPIAQSMWLHELASKTGIPEGALKDELAGIAMPREAEAPRSPEPALSGAEKKPRSRRELLAERLLGSFMSGNNSEMLGDVIEYFPDLHRTAYGVLALGKKGSGDPAVSDLLNIAALASASSEGEEIGELKRQLAKEYFRERREMLVREIGDAERAEDEKRMAVLMGELDAIASRMNIYEKEKTA